MENVLLFLSLLLLVTFIYFLKQEYFGQTVSPKQQNFIDTKLTPFFDKIKSIINDPDYNTVSKLVPDQTEFLVRTSLTTRVLPGDPDKIKEYSSKFPKVLEQAKELSEYYNRVILNVQGSWDIYSDIQKKSFVTYYTALKNNTDIVVRYLSNNLN